MNLTRREALIYLLETLPDAQVPDQSRGRTGSIESRGHAFSRMYHEGSYAQLDHALTWLKANHSNAHRHLTHHYNAPYTIRYACPICQQTAPPEGLIHKHRDQHGNVQKVAAADIRVYQRPTWLDPATIEAAIDLLLSRMPQFIKVPAREEAA